MTDPLGRRNVRPSFTEPRGSQVLTEDQIDAIAADVRTKPLADVGRHVMPLIQHVVGLDMRTCQNCRWWVAYCPGESDRVDGECTRHAGDRAPMRLSVIMQPDGLAEAFPGLRTAFDFGCRAWEQKQEQHDAQASL